MIIGKEVSDGSSIHWKVRLAQVGEAEAVIGLSPASDH